MATPTRPRNIIAWQEVPNPHCRLYHVKESMVLPGKGIASFREWDDESSEEPMEALTAPARKMAEVLLSINGRACISVSRYEVQVVKAPLFTWREVQPKVLNAIKLIFSDPAQVEVRRMRTSRADEERPRRTSRRPQEDPKD